MKIRPIKTEADYESALAAIEQLCNAEAGTPEGDKLDILATLVEHYEEMHDSIPLPDRPHHSASPQICGWTAPASTPISA